MADTDTAKPMTDADIASPPAEADFTPAAPLKDAAAGFDTDKATSGSKVADARQAISDGASKYGQQAADKARLVAEDGKAKASGALDQLAQLLDEAAGTVDDKLGEQYGSYARSAAGVVSTLSDSVKAKDVDTLIEDARAFVKKSPGVAVGVAAAIGFVVARLAQSSLETKA